MEKIYLCGPTVYSKAHIGNIRPILTFDIFIRAKQFLNQAVNLIHNITDIDDKIIAKALHENVSEKAVATKYQKHYLKLLKTLNIQTPQLLPTVTDNIEVIIDFIKQLILQNAAYEQEGNVWFDILKAKNYGSISHQLLSSLHFEKQDFNKKHEGDFALWKKTSIGQTFASPWGQGRPGWHTECAALINYYNNSQTLDLHGGGIDLIFPHHENENAQFMALHNFSITKKWMHIGHLNIAKQKMSKSLGNVIDTEEFIELHGTDTLRMLFLITNPTSPITLNDNLIINTKKLIAKFTKVYLQAQLVTNQIKSSNDSANQITANSFFKKISQWQFANAMKDLNLLIKKFYQNFDSNDSNLSNVQEALDIIAIIKIIGFSFTKLQISEEDQNLYQDWKRLRQKKQYIKADAIRKKLQVKKLI